jgi:hypothetical protein
MRWGKVVDIDANEDTQLVAESVKTAATQGIPAGSTGLGASEAGDEDAGCLCRIW